MRLRRILRATMVAAALSSVISCSGSSGSGDPAGPARIVGSNLGGAQYTFAATNRSDIAAGVTASEAKQLFKVDDAGNVTRVTFYDENGAEVVLQESPAATRKTGPNHVLLSFADGQQVLIHVLTGAVINLTGVQLDLSSAATDENGNIYGLSGTQLVRFDAATATLSALTSETEPVEKFHGVTANGDSVYSIFMETDIIPNSGRALRIRSASGTVTAPFEGLVAAAQEKTTAEKSAVAFNPTSAKVTFNEIINNNVYMLVSVEYQTNVVTPDQLRRDMLYKTTAAAGGELLHTSVGEIYDAHATGQIKFYMGSAAAGDGLFLFYFVPTLTPTIEAYAKSNLETVELVATSAPLPAAACSVGTELVDLDGTTFFGINQPTMTSDCYDNVADFSHLLSFSHTTRTFTQVIDFTQQSYAIRRLSVDVSASVYYYGEKDGGAIYARFSNGITETQATAFPDEPHFLTRLY